MKNINKKEIIVIIVLVLLALGFSYWYNNGSIFGEITSVCFEERCFAVEIADSDEERRIGLMFRESLGLDNGMLFIFEEERNYLFWMKDTFIPLDIIWINKEREVIFVANAVPCLTDGECNLINPIRKALYVLEVNSGIVNEIGLKVGDKVDFKRG